MSQKQHKKNQAQKPKLLFLLSKTNLHKILSFFFAISIKHRIFARRKETAKRGCPDSIGILIKLI